MVPVRPSAHASVVTKDNEKLIKVQKKDEEKKKEKEERKVVDNKGSKGGKDKLLDKDWGAKIPDYISRSILSLLVFIMGLTMKVLRTLVFALK